MPSHYLLLFAKYPYQGKVKTRLEPALGSVKVQAFAATALLEVLHYFGSLSGAKVAGLPCRCVWCFAPSAASDDVLRFLREHNLRDKWEAWPQADEAANLGDRLSAAVQRASGLWNEEERPGQTCTLIGSDCFHLTTSHIIAGIERASTRVSLLYPAGDGGYVQLSLPLPTPITTFENIRWSTADTAQDQLLQLRSIGVDVEKGETLSDVDEPADLQMFLAKDVGEHLKTVYPRTLSFVRKHVKAI